MLKEFKKFAMRGNVLDMAVGVIIGGAFGKIVGSLVGDILMPPVGLLLGKVQFTGLFIDLSGTHPASLEAARQAGLPTINYGLFLQALVDFLIIAFVIFLLIRQVNRILAQPEEKPAAPTTKECPRCCSVIPMKATKCAHCTSELKAA